MIKKQNLWFLTLLSLILVLGVYYITMPNEVIVNSMEDDVIDVTFDVEESSYITALKAEQDTERQTLKNELEEILSNTSSTSEEKNNAYLKIKYINELNGEEEVLEEQIKKEYKLDSFIDVDNDDILVVIKKESHDSLLANNIMRLIQDNYDTKKNISIKFS